MTPRDERAGYEAHVLGSLKRRSRRLSELVPEVPVQLRGSAHHRIVEWKVDCALQRLRRRGAIHFGHGAWHLGGAA